MRPTRILFQCHNRRGLGHLMRGMNLAQAIRNLVPSTDFLLYTCSNSAALPADHGFAFFLETAEWGMPHWLEVLQSYQPDIVVYDTMLPKDAAEAPVQFGTYTVYVMRKSKADRQQEIFANAILERADLVLIPHTPEEFGYQLPLSIADKSVFVGPIVRSPDSAAQTRLRQAYQICDTDFVLTSTVGGGGFAEQAQEFFAKVFAVHQQLAPRMPNLRHLVIQGPNFATTLPPMAGMTIIEQEPELINLLAISDLVIAEGGYNTVNEIRSVKTPAAFLPSVRNFDDQEERVRLLEAQGLAFVFPEGALETTAQQIADVCCSPELLTNIRKHYLHDSMQTGNQIAAQRILELVNL